MLYTVYQVTHKESGKVYIGKHQTNDLNDGYMGSGKLICSAIKKYGVGAFNKEILYVFETEEEMNTKEAELVNDEFCLREDTYNLCPGGQGGWGYVNTQKINGVRGSLSTTHKENLSDSVRIFYQSLSKSELRHHGLKTRIRENRSTGHNHSLLTRSKMSFSHKGKHVGQKNSQFGTMWITDGVQTLKVRNDYTIPEGWKRGRKINGRRT